MREFSDFEKQILHIFVALYKVNKLCRANVLYEIYRETVYIINKTDDLNPLKYKKTLDITSILNDLVSIKFLYDYLLNNGYIVESSSTELSVEFNRIGILLDGYKEYDPRYPNSISWINASNQSNKIWLSQVLIDFVENKFKTSTQLQFRKQQRVAWCGIIVGVIIGLIGIGFNIYSIHKPTSFKESKQIEQEIRSVETEAPKLMNQQIKNDTLKVNMIKK